MSVPVSVFVVYTDIIAAMACSSFSGDRWLYRMVIRMVACPRYFDTTAMGTCLQLGNRFNVGLHFIRIQTNSNSPFSNRVGTSICQCDEK